MKNVTMIRRKSILTGNVSHMQIAMPPAEFAQRERDWKDGTLIQDAFPEQSADIREYIMNGITAEEWEKFA